MSVAAPSSTTATMSTVADGGRVVCTGARRLIAATDCLSRAPSVRLDCRRTTQEHAVPVTAKLSRKFYEKFGDELTNELVEWFNQVDATYRSELREVNELNFARFEAKLEQVKAELRAEFQTGLASLEGRLLARIGVLEGRFGTLESRLVRWMFLFWAASLGTVLALR